MTIVKFKNAYYMFRKYAKMLMVTSILLLMTTITFNQHAREEIIRAEQKLTTVVDLKQLKCLATNVFYEARNESKEGKAAVARVTMNRVNYGFANTPCNVVYQITTVKKEDEINRFCQFSWVCEGKGNPNKNDPNYRVSLQVAYDVLVLEKYKDVVPQNTLFFHSISVEPNWHYYQKIRVIGNHIFYSKKPKQKHESRKK